MNPLLLTDGYKTSHHVQYPENTVTVVSNFTPRANRYAPNGANHVVVFGTQMVMMQIHEMFQKDFFDKPKDEVCGEIKKELSLYLNTDYDVTHFEKLHDLGFLPIQVLSLPEGELAPIRVPVLMILNTHPDFYWVTNYLETILSNLLWKPMTSATIAREYRKTLQGWQEKTDKDRGWFVDWQGHDFSMRGMDSVEAVVASGLGHATSFLGSDSLPVIHGARKFYGEEGFVVGSVPATEHSVMSAGGKEDEIETFRRLLKIYPTGILSVVSDTWDLWKVCTEYLPKLKDEVLARDGKLVIRPDSGDPVDILCGNKVDTFGNWKNFQDEEYKGVSEKTFRNICESKGVIELLWDVFGGTINEQGYKVLDPHIGAIYGDSITIERANAICERLAAKGFASTNVVLGIGSYTYQYNTRDSFGFAVKATYVELAEVVPSPESDKVGIKIVGREIFKDPITDDGMKKSARGLIKVVKDQNDEYVLIDQVNWDDVNAPNNELKLIYDDGYFYNTTTLTEIRSRIAASIKN